MSDWLWCWWEGLAFMDPMGLKQSERQFLACYHPQGMAQIADSRLKHTLSLPVKKAYLLVLEPQPDGQVYHTSRGYRGAVKEQRPSLCSSLALLQLTSTSQKEAYPFIWSPRFCNFAKMTPQYHLVWRPAGFTIAVPQDCICFHTLKDAARG